MYPKDYIEYLVHFHGNRDYFECHEILEEFWKKTDPGNKQSILVAFIQLAVANYHHRRQNFRGAYRTLKNAENIFKKNREQLQPYGMEDDTLIKMIEERIQHIQKEKSYRSMILPIKDSKLVAECGKICDSRGWRWGEESDLSASEIVHRHTRRDRSEVILERKLALKERQEKRQ